MNVSYISVLIFSQEDIAMSTVTDYRVVLEGPNGRSGVMSGLNEPLTYDEATYASEGFAGSCLRPRSRSRLTAPIMAGRNR